MADRENLPYAIGNKRPPRATQFKPGQSGNPNGRPKGAKSFATLIEQELSAKIPVRENDARRKITKREAVAKQLVNKAAAGDLKAMPILLNETRVAEAFAGTSGAGALNRSEDHLTMANIVKRIREADPAAGDVAARPDGRSDDVLCLGPGDET